MKFVEGSTWISGFNTLNESTNIMSLLDSPQIFGSNLGLRLYIRVCTCKEVNSSD